MSKTEVMYSISKITGVIKKHKLTLIGVVVGLAGGLLYWKFIGCTSGSCPITSSPYASTVWGAAMGGFLFSAFEKEKK